MGISFQSLEQLKPDVVWGVLGNDVQNNERLRLSDRLEMHLEHFRMPSGNVSRDEKTKGRSLDVSAIKNSFVFVKTALYTWRMQ